MIEWGGRAAAELTALTLATYGRRCHLCGRMGATTADHVIARNRGGPDTLENLRPAHKSCNSARGDRPLSVWFAAHPLPTGRAPASLDWTSPPPGQPSHDDA